MTDTSTTEPSSPPESGGRSGRRASSGGVAKSAAFSLGRGLILIAVAVVIGIVLLQVVDNGSTSKSSTSTSTTATTAAKSSTTATTGGTATTSATKALTPTSDLSIVVLNATGQTGVAKSISDKLGAAPLSYKTLTPGNTSKSTGNVVYYTGDLSGEAAAMATAVNAATQGVTGVAGETKVEKMPDPKPKDWSAPDVSKAQMVIVIGAK